MTYEQIAQRVYAQLVSLPEGVQVARIGKIKYYWYNQISDASKKRLWKLMNTCPQLVNRPVVHIWLGTAGRKRSSQA